MRPTVCHGHKAHAKGCRIGRPACRWRRREARVTCRCGAYHFPHREGSGRCGDSEAMERFVHGPLPENWRELLAADDHQSSAAE